MKRVICPKCDNYIYFDAGACDSNNKLFFRCTQCGKEFYIDPAKLQRKSDALRKRAQEEQLASLVVLENGFGYRQEFPLFIGDNIVGRRSKGTVVQVPIVTNDPSLGRNHCAIMVKVNNAGETVCLLRDLQSLTGTSIGSAFLGKKEQARLNDSDVITIGATTLIFRSKEALNADNEI